MKSKNAIIAVIGFEEIAFIYLVFLAMKIILKTS